MLSTRKDEFGNLLGVCEWHLVNQDGQQDIHGTWVWIQQIELSPHMSMAPFARWLIHDVATRCPTAQVAYWQRRRNSASHPNPVAFWNANKQHHYGKAKLMAYSQKHIEEVTV